MYKITNTSGCLSIYGLYPGESKLVQQLTSDMKHAEKSKILIITKEEIQNKKTTNKIVDEEKEITTTIEKKDEVK